MTDQTRFQNKKVTIPIQATITTTKDIEREGQKVREATFVITDPGWPELTNVPRLQGTTELDPDMPDSVFELAITEFVKRDLLQFVALGIIAEVRAREEQKQREQEMYAEIGRRFVEMKKAQEEQEEKEKVEMKKAQESQAEKVAQAIQENAN